MFFFGICCSFFTESIETGSFIFWSSFKGKLDPGPREIGSRLNWALLTSRPEKASHGVSPKELLVQQEIPKKAHFHRSTLNLNLNQNQRWTLCRRRILLPSPPPSRGRCLLRLWRRLSLNRRFRSHWSQISPGVSLCSFKDMLESSVVGVVRGQFSPSMCRILHL